MISIDHLPTPAYNDETPGAHASFLMMTCQAAHSVFTVNGEHGILPLALGPAQYREYRKLPVYVAPANDPSSPDPLLEGIPVHPGAKPVNLGTPHSIAVCAQYQVDVKEYNSLISAIQRLKTYILAIAHPSVTTALSVMPFGMSHTTIAQIMVHMKTNFDKHGPMDITRNNVVLSTKFTGGNNAPMSSHIAKLTSAIKEAARIDDAKSAAAQLSILCDTVLGSKNGRYDTIIRDYSLTKKDNQSFAGLSELLVEADKWHDDKMQVAFGTANAAVASPPPEASAAVSLPPHLTAYTVNLSKLSVDERALFVKLAAKAGAGTNYGKGTAATGTREPIMCTTKGPNCTYTFVPINDRIAATGKCKPCWEAAIRSTVGFGKK